MGELFLELSGVSKSFGDRQALEPLDMAVDEGEFLTLLGPSGCGKSTLLRMISGFEQPTSGRISFRGHDLRSVSPERRPFNMVFQSYALFPHMSVAANISYGPRTAKVDRAEVARRVDAMLELVHLQGFESRPVTELSGGQRQRVALARALINDPEVLLLDEPLGALDLQLRKSLQEELRLIQRRLGTTFVYVTHDQDEALMLSDRIAVIDGGRLIQIGTPKEIYEYPATRFVAEFVGESNLIDCRVIDVAGSRVVVRFVNGSTGSLGFHTSAGVLPGRGALAVLRPQHLQLVQPDDASFVGVIEESVFLGTHCRHVVVLAQGTRLVVNADPTEAVASGQRVGVRLRDGRGVVVPCDSREGASQAEDVEILEAR